MFRDSVAQIFNGKDFQSLGADTEKARPLKIQHNNTSSGLNGLWTAPASQVQHAGVTAPSTNTTNSTKP